jgi:trimeric autotransporter adhesin
MSQNDFTIANQGFPAFRADLNTALQALATNNSGATAPSTMFANMWWYDSSSNIMYIRNEDNDAWIKFAELDQTNDKFVLSGTLQLDDGTVSAPALTFNSDTNMGLYRGGTDILRFVTAGVDRLQISADGSISTPTLGTSNFRAGVNAGNSIESGGNYNTVVGDEAGTAITTGDYNTAIGYSSQISVTTAGSNVSIGANSLRDNVTGTQNTALGHASLIVNTASSNTAIGWLSLSANTTGTDNVAVGGTALQANTTASYNTAVGKSALYLNTTGAYNTAFSQSLVSNTTGANNTAVGWGALYGNTTASDNTAVGRQTLQTNSTGASNTAIGQGALFANTTASNNTAVGYQALQANTTGSENCASGYLALATNTTGIYNTGLGKYALGGTTTGQENTGVGWHSLQSNTTGSSNTAVGRTALGANTTGNNSVAVGWGALDLATTGGQNIGIGVNADVASAGDSYCIVIGTLNTNAKGSTTGFINPNGGGVYQGNNASTWSTTSDQRLKKNIVDNTVGLDAINQVQVRNFEYRTEDEITELPTHSAIDKQGVQLGVIAQEIQSILPDMVKEESTGVLSVNPDNMTWHLVNAVKELSAQVTALTERLTTLEGE